MGALALGVAALAVSSFAVEDRPLERWLGYFAVPGMVLAEGELIGMDLLRDPQHCVDRVGRVGGERRALRSTRCEVGYVAAVRVGRVFHSDGGHPRPGETVLALLHSEAARVGRPGVRVVVALADPAGAAPLWAGGQFHSWTDLRRAVYVSRETGAARFAPTERLRLLESWSRAEDVGSIVEALGRGSPAFSRVEPPDGAIVKGEIPVEVSCAPEAADEARVAVLGGPQVVLPVVNGRGNGYLDLAGEDGPLYLTTQFVKDGQVVASLRSELLAANRRPWSWSQIGGVGFRNALGPGAHLPPLGGRCGDEVCDDGEAARCPADCPEILGAVAIHFRVVGERTVEFSATVTLPSDEAIESFWWDFDEPGDPESLPAPRYTFATGGLHVVTVGVESSIGTLTAVAAVDLDAAPVPGQPW